MVEQIAVAAVGFLGRGEARELPHRPQLAPVHVGMDAASEREAARLTQIGARVEAARTVAGVDLLDGGPRESSRAIGVNFVAWRGR